MREYLARPGFLGTHGTIGADLSYLLAIVFTVLFLIGWYLGRRHMGGKHHSLVLWAMVSMLAYFSLYYLTRRLGVLAIEGKEGFGGSDWLYTYIFSPIITIHILLVSIGLIMAVYMITLGFRTSVKKVKERILKAEDLKISPRGFIRLVTGSFVVLALIVLIRCRTVRCLMVYISGFIIVTIVLLLEKGLERVIPNGARRHRLLGRFTMTLFLIVLITSTLTYLFLYILYPPILPEG